MCYRYDLIKHVRKTHPNRPARIIKLDPDQKESKDNFGGKLMINDSRLKLQEINQSELTSIEGVIVASEASIQDDMESVQDEDSMDSTPDAPPEQSPSPTPVMLTTSEKPKPKSPAMAGSIVLNCNMCSFNTRVTEDYVAHLKSHQNDEEESMETDDSREMTPESDEPSSELVPDNTDILTPGLTMEEHRRELIQKSGELIVKMTDIIYISEEELDMLLAKYGVSTFTLPPEFIVTLQGLHGGQEDEDEEETISTEQTTQETKQATQEAENSKV